MRAARQWVLIAVVGMAAAVAGYAYNAWRTAPDEASRSGLDALTAMRLPDLEGALQSIDQWRGRVVVVNFWATWCAPCREEIPIFVKLQDKYRDRGLQFVGIAVDQPEKVRPYAAEMGMNFPILIGGAGVLDVTRALGNRAGVLPYTVVLSRDGTVAARRIGVFPEDALERLLPGLLQARP